MKQRIKAAALLFILAVTAMIPFLSGTGGHAFDTSLASTKVHAEGSYDKLAVELVGATAFDDARNAIKSAEDQTAAKEQFKENLGLICGGEHFGNVGIFIGPKGSSAHSDVWSVYQSKVTISNDQIQVYDGATGGAFSKYKAFGGAIQKLNTDGKKSQGSSASLEKGMNEMASAGTKITNLGATLLMQYNPAPVMLSLFDSEKLNQYPDNKLMQLVNGNKDLKEVVKTLGGKFVYGIPFSAVLLFFAVLFLLVTSVFMTLVNGRSAGENIRKALWKFMIGCAAVPLVAGMLDSGVNFLNDVTTKQAEVPQSDYVESNLNLADWYACGFALPVGTTVTISKDGEFLFTPEAVKAINQYTYSKLYGKSNPSDNDMMEKMEEYYSMHNGMPMGVGFSEPMKDDGTTWKTENLYATLSNFGENKPLTDGIEVAGMEHPELANVGYYFSNGLNMTKDGKKWRVSGVPDKNWGISPIAATNLMRTSFTGSSVIVTSNPMISAVAFDVDNAIGDDEHMPAIVRFLAMFSMIIAALKGLFTIFSAGFAGVVGGGAKTLTGSSMGLGQAVGGVVALLGGVFGIGVIMTLSYTLLDQMYGVMHALLHGVEGGGDILDPLKDAVKGIKIIGPILAPILKSFSRFILTVLCALALPKFGGIPITLFCQYMAELPGRFAEKAQAMENKFTGDFRGGAGGHSNGMANAISAAKDGSASARAALGGLGAAAGAAAAFGLNKAGQVMEGKYKDSDMGEEEGSKSMSGTESEDGTKDETKDAAEKAAAAAAGSEGTKPEKEKENGKNPDGSGEPTKAEKGTGANPVISNLQNGGDTKNVEEGGLKESKEETLNAKEGDATTEMEQEEQQKEVETEMSDAVRSDSIGTDSSMSQESVDSEQLGENEQVMEASTLNDQLSEEDSSSESSAIVAGGVEGEGTPSVDGEKSMAGASTEKSTAKEASSAQSALKGNGASKGAESGATRSSMSGASGNERKELTKEQKHNRRMMATAKALQAAGSHTTGAQAIAGIAAGTAHAVGSTVGAGNTTQKGINAVRNYKQRQNDIRAGLGANYSRNLASANEQTKPDTGSVNTKLDAGANTRESAQAAAMYAEVLAREAEEARARQYANRD